MRRTFLIALVVLGCEVKAGAETIWLGGNNARVSWGLIGSTKLGTDFDRVFNWEVCDLSGNNCGEQLSFRRTWADRGTTLTIEREDFPSYGIDADAIETAIGEFGSHTFKLGFGDFRFGPFDIQNPHGEYKVTDFTIDRMEWNFTMDFASYQMFGYAYGTGTIAPEPSGLALMAPLFGLVLLSRKSLHCPRKSVQSSRCCR